MVRGMTDSMSEPAPESAAAPIRHDWSLEEVHALCLQDEIHERQRQQLSLIHI